MIDYIQQFVCLFLLAMSLLFIIVELRARFEKSFLIFGVTNLLLSFFCAIDIWIQPRFAALEWTKVQHIIGAFFPAFILWYLMVLLKHVNRFMIRSLFLLSGCFSVLFISNLMLKLSQKEAIGTLLYNITFAPFIVISVASIMGYVAVNIHKADGKEKKALIWQLIGLAALGFWGIVDMAGIVKGNRLIPEVASSTILGLLIFGLIMTFVFADRLSNIIKDKEKTFLKMQEACRELEAALPLARLGESVAMVNHEIKNKAFAISATLNALKRVPFSPVIREKIDQCSERAGAIADFSRDLVEQTRPVAGRMQQVDLRECVTGLIRSFPYGKQGLFHCELPDTGLKILGDPVKLQSVFENLFLNSIQAGATQIGVRASAMKEAVVVSVEDNGAGCDRETAKRLFTPFFTTKKDQHGAGLGLAVSKNIVESHGGSISAQLKNLSESGTGGLIVTVTLPVIGPQAIGN